MSREALQMPVAADAERVVLAALIGRRDLIKETAPYLEGSFYSTVNGQVFGAMMEMEKEGIEPDLNGLAEYLKKEKIPVSMESLLDIQGAFAGYSNLEWYCSILREKDLRRKAICSASLIQIKAANEETPVQEIINLLTQAAEQAAETIENGKQGPDRRGRLIGWDELTADAERYYSEGLPNRGVNPGWPKLREHWRPAKGTLNICTGIPSHGKSEFVDALMVNIAEESNWKWAIFSPENYPYILHIQKLAEKYMRMPMLGPNRMSASEFKAALSWLQRYFFFIEPNENFIDIETVLMLAQGAIDKHGVCGVVIDPWNELEMSLRKGESETDFIGRSLMRCRRFARKNDVHLLIVAHPAKMYKNEKTGRYDVPTLYNISGSAHWYNKADCGLTVYRDFENDIIDLHIQKVKFKIHGRVGVVYMKYDKVTGRFNEICLKRGNNDYSKS